MNWAAIFALILCGTVIILKVTSDYFDDCHEERQHQYRMALLTHGGEECDDAEDEDEGILPCEVEEVSP